MSRLTDDLRELDVLAAPPRLDDADAAVSYAAHDTAIGRILLACKVSGALITVAFAPDHAAEVRWLGRVAKAVSPQVLRRPGQLDDARRQMDDYLGGRRSTFDLPLDLALATPFQGEVLPALAAGVGYGERTTYAALASTVGRPRASRAVGAALGANPLCVVLPCHRVLAASGALTGYAGGLEAKRYLLELESAPSSR